jgi:hypothetical protein
MEQLYQLFQGDETGRKSQVRQPGGRKQRSMAKCTCKHSGYPLTRTGLLL